jgi:hypothetical protein
VFSCLPLELKAARQIFRDTAALSLSKRWSSVSQRHHIARFHGRDRSAARWSVVAWFRGDDLTFVVPGFGERAALGQSVCVLERPRTI